MVSHYESEKVGDAEVVVSNTTVDSVFDTGTGCGALAFRRCSISFSNRLFVELYVGTPTSMAEAGPSRAPRATPASTSAHAASSPSDPPPAFERWRKSISHFTGLGLSEEEQAQRTQQQDDSVIERDFNRCEKWKASLMESSTSFLALPCHLQPTFSFFHHCRSSRLTNEQAQ